MPYYRMNGMIMEIVATKEDHNTVADGRRLCQACHICPFCEANND